MELAMQEQLTQVVVEVVRIQAQLPLLPPMVALVL
jgi:hypothetical protein